MENEIKKIDYNEFMDSLSEREIKPNEEMSYVPDISQKDYYGEMIKALEDKTTEPDYKFIKKYGAIKLYLVKFKLVRYIKKQEKYDKLLRKYNTLHNSLSLAIASGFPDIKKHQEYLKNLAKRTAEKSDKFRGEVNNGNN